MNCKEEGCGNLLIIDGDMLGCSKCRKWWHKDELIIDNWYVELAKNQTIWKMEDINEYPYIIKHEYKRLQKLLMDGQTYGAIFQLKDMFEVLLKFPMLIFLSDIYWERNKTDEEVNVLLSLLTKPISLGDWHKIGYKVYNIMKKKYYKYKLVELFNDVLLMFENNKIVNWRNNQIGHGALGFDYDEEFQSDLYSKIKLLYDHFQKYNEIYSSIKLWNEEKENNSTEVSDDFNKVSDNRRIICEFGEYKFNLNPFFKIYKSKMYFFDYYFSLRKQLYLLDYSYGKKEVLEVELFSTIIKSFYKELVASISDSQLRDVDDIFYTLEDAKVLKLFEEKDEYVEQIYLYEKLQSILEENKKGIIHFQMEQGTGKTTFCKALDPLWNGCLKLKNTYVRAYYIDQAKGGQLSNFISSTSIIFTQNKKHEVDILGNTFAYSWRHENYSKELTKFLNDAFLIQKKASNAQKLLFIIDGWDEMDSKKSLENILPDVDELLDGIYILVTSRTINEMKSQIKLYERVSNVATANMVFSKENDEYIQLLKNYLVNIDENISDAELNKILLQVDYSFLYLNPLLKMKSNINSLKDYDIDKISIEYIKFLQKLYGEKLFRQLKEILCILAISNHTLSIRDLCSLSSHEKITFKFIAILNDLRAVLKIERTVTGSRVYLKDEGIIKMVEHDWLDFIKSEVKRWEKKILLMVRNKESISKDEQFVRLVIYYETVKKFNMKPINLMQSEFEILLRSIIYVMDGKPLIYNEMKWRLFHLINEYYSCYLELATEETTEFFYEYANVSLVLGEYEKCISYATKAIKYSKLTESGNSEFQEDIGKYCYLVRGSGYQHINNIKNSIFDYENAFEILIKQLINDEDVSMKILEHISYFTNELIKFYEGMKDKSKLVKMRNQLQKAFIRLPERFNSDARYLFICFKIAIILKDFDEVYKHRDKIIKCINIGCELSVKQIWEFYDLNSSLSKELSQQDDAITFCKYAIEVAKNNQLNNYELYSLITLAVLNIDNDDKKEVNNYSLETISLCDKVINLYEERLKIYSLDEIPLGILISIEAIYSVMLDNYLLNSKYKKLYNKEDSIRKKSDNNLSERKLINKIGNLYDMAIVLKEFFIKNKVGKREKSLLKYIGEVNAYYDNLGLYDIQKQYIDKLQHYLNSDKLMKVLTLGEICYYEYIVFFYFSKINNFSETIIWGEKIIRHGIMLSTEDKVKFNTYFKNCIIVLKRLYVYERKQEKILKLDQYLKKYIK